MSEPIEFYTYQTLGMCGGINDSVISQVRFDPPLSHKESAKLCDWYPALFDYEIDHLVSRLDLGPHF